MLHMRCAASGTAHFPVFVVPSARQLSPSTHSRLERQIAPSLTVPLMIPRQPATVGEPTDATQSQPEVSFVTIAAHASRSAASRVTAPERRAELSVRMHSPV